MTMDFRHSRSVHRTGSAPSRPARGSREPPLPCTTWTSHSSRPRIAQPLHNLWPLVAGRPFGPRQTFICLPCAAVTVSPGQRPNGGLSVLVLTRKVGESVRIGADVKVTVLGVRGAPNQVRIGVSASPDVAVHREEVFERIRERAEARAGTRQEGSDSVTPSR